MILMNTLLSQSYKQELLTHSLERNDCLDIRRGKFSMSHRGKGGDLAMGR